MIFPEVVPLVTFLCIATLVTTAVLTMLSAVRLAMRGRVISGVTGTLGAVFLSAATLALPIVFTASALFAHKKHEPLKAFLSLMKEDIFLMGWSLAALIAATSLALHAVSMWTGAASPRAYSEPEG